MTSEDRDPFDDIVFRRTPGSSMTSTSNDKHDTGKIEQGSIFQELSVDLPPLAPPSLQDEEAYNSSNGLEALVEQDCSNDLIVGSFSKDSTAIDPLIDSSKNQNPTTSSSHKTLTATNVFTLHSLSPAVTNDLILAPEERQADIYKPQHSLSPEVSNQLFFLASEKRRNAGMTKSLLPPHMENNKNTNEEYEELVGPTPINTNLEQESRKKTYLDCSRKDVHRYWIFASLAILIVASSLIGTSLKRVSSIAYGVQYNVWSKKLATTSQMGGLYFGPVGYTFIKFPSTQLSTEVIDTCVSRDGLRVDYHVVYQYKLEKEWIIDAILKYRDYDKWTQLIHASGNSAIQHSCSAWNVTDFQTERLSVQESMFSNLQLKLEGDSGHDDTGIPVATNKTWLFARASSLQLIYVGLPTEYKDAVAEKQREEEDIALAKNERTQSITKATTELKAAEKQAQMIMDRAYNDGNITLTLAGFRADRTLYRFEREIQVFSQAKTFLNLDPNGVVSYVANKLFEKGAGLNAHFGEPAQISRKNLLVNQP